MTFSLLIILIYKIVPKKHKKNIKVVLNKDKTKIKDKDKNQKDKKEKNKILKIEDTQDIKNKI